VERWREPSPSSSAYFAEPSSISQMRFSQMEGRARYSPEYTDIDMSVDPNAKSSRASAPRGSNAFHFTIDLNMLAGSAPHTRR
jgi:hypothetical protein